MFSSLCTLCECAMVGTIFNQFLLQLRTIAGEEGKHVIRFSVEYPAATIHPKTCSLR